MAYTVAKTAPPTSTTAIAISTVTLPRITIEFCTQCKWNLRAAYYAQELLQTFGTSVGEVSLMPSTGGTFVVKLFHQAIDVGSVDGKNGNEGLNVLDTVIWDRKEGGGFPETKELKNRVRNVIEPGRNLGHTDRALKKGKEEVKAGGADKGDEPKNKGNEKEECKDCA